MDAQYALSHYDEYASRYEEKSGNAEKQQSIPENEKEITTFADTGCVEGSWTQDEHESQEMIEGNYFNVRYGARFPDTSRYGDEEHRIFARKSLNPWWHGYYATNYISAVMYSTRMANAVGRSGIEQQGQAATGGYKDAWDMRKDIDYLDSNGFWSVELARMKKRYGQAYSKAITQEDTAGFRRAFIWGMAIHSATDIFAHSAYVNSVEITHTDNIRGQKDADDVQTIPERNMDAHIIAQQMMKKYKLGANVELETNDLVLPNGASTYRLRNMYGYINVNSNSYLAARTVSYSITFSSK